MADRCFWVGSFRILFRLFSGRFRRVHLLPFSSFFIYIITPSLKIDMSLYPFCSFFVCLKRYQLITWIFPRSYFQSHCFQSIRLHWSQSNCFFFLQCSPYSNTSVITAFPPFWIQPSDFSSSLLIGIGSRLKLLTKV